MNNYETKLQSFLEIVALKIWNYADSVGILDRELRYGRSWIAVSDIRLAYYCERYLDIGYSLLEKELSPVELAQVERDTEVVARKQDVGSELHEISCFISDHIEEQSLRGIYKKCAYCWNGR